MLGNCTTDQRGTLGSSRQHRDTERSVTTFFRLCPNMGLLFCGVWYKGKLEFFDHGGRTASCPTALAWIPACGCPAPGSSGILASAVPPRHAQ